MVKKARLSLAFSLLPCRKVFTAFLCCKKIMFMLFLVFVTSSCSLYRVNYEEVTDNFYAPKKAEDIAVMDNAAAPHEIIGYVTVNTERNQDMEEVFARMKTEAARLGGDAIINIQSNATGTWKKIPAQHFIGNAYVRANYTATVIAFTQ